MSDDSNGANAAVQANTVVFGGGEVVYNVEDGVNIDLMPESISGSGILSKKVQANYCLREATMALL